MGDLRIRIVPFLSAISRCIRVLAGSFTISGVRKSQGGLLLANELVLTRTKYKNPKITKMYVFMNEMINECQDSITLWLKR